MVCLASNYAKGLIGEAMAAGRGPGGGQRACCARRSESLARLAAGFGGAPEGNSLCGRAGEN